MKQTFVSLALVVSLSTPVLAQISTEGVDKNGAQGSSAPAAGVSPPASKTVIPEIPANKKPDMETITSPPANGSGSGTSGTGLSPIDTQPQHQ